MLNAPRARALMQGANLDALVLTSPINIRYFSDYWLWSDQLFRQYMLTPGAGAHRQELYAVYPLEGEPALVLPTLSAANAADSWVRDIFAYGWAPIDFKRRMRPEFAESMRAFGPVWSAAGPADPLDALLAALTRRGLLTGRLGVEFEGMAVSTADRLRGALSKAAVADATNLVRLVRMVKSPEEIRLLKRAAEINESSALEAMTQARPGASIKRISEQFRISAARHGADVDHAAFGFRGLGIATEPDWVLSDEVMFVDFGCVYSGYFSDSGWTCVVGTAEPWSEYEALQDCIQAGAGALKPGVLASEVQAQMQWTLAAHGITASFPHGHGLGLEIRDYPILVPDNGLRIQDGCIDVASDLQLIADMVVNLEVSTWYAGAGSLQLEKTFAVTADGSMPLIEQDRSHPFSYVGRSGASIQ